MNTENDDYLGALKDSLNESSKYNRRIITATLLIVFYLLITVASTTDLQLLMPDSKIKLPLITKEFISKASLKACFCHAGLSGIFL